MTELTTRGTLGGQIARQIEHDIRINGWREGHLIGSEAELISQHGVGVAAVREAVRILEARGLARTRRGPGGGLLVTAPDRRLVTDAARRHLEHAGVDRAELFEVWLALEQVAVTKLATSIDIAGAQRLRAVLRKEDERQLAEAWEDLPNIHLEIAQLAGNRALELFIEVLTEMSLNQYGTHTNPRTMVRWLHARHVELVEAIIAGDAPMAALHLRRLTEQLASPDDMSIN
ncbi:FadR/GntR family transcriptional regulator [Mycolicibacterium hodleri]|nr:FCD domain-containing protein [Mycolicibacterium hodleri]